VVIVIWPDGGGRNAAVQFLILDFRVWILDGFDRLTTSFGLTGGWILDIVSRTKKVCPDKHG